MSDPTVDVTEEQLKDLTDIAGHAIDTKLRENLVVCHTTLDKAKAEGDRQVFFVQSDSNPALRLYGVKTPSHHAVFAVALGFVPDRADFQIYVGEPELREGPLEQPDTEVES